VTEKHSYPLFAGLFGALWFGRSSRGPQRLGMAVGFVGIALISTDCSAEGESAPWGVVMVLAAKVCYGVATNVAGPLQHKYGSVRLMGLMLGLGTLWTMPFGLAGLSESGWLIALVVATVVFGIVGAGLAFVLMATLVGRFGGRRASFITYQIPLVALAMGALFLGESVTPIALAGVGWAVGASILAARAET
jgi:drug/metabolite transporter (DMT)-like permease